MSKGKKKKKTAGDIFTVYHIDHCRLRVCVFSCTIRKDFSEYRAGTQEYDRIREYVREEPQEETDESQESKDSPVPS